MSASGKPELGGIIPENTGSSDLRPIYSPGIEYEEIGRRGWRTAKFMLVGAALGFGLGLVIGTPLAFRMVEINPVTAGAIFVSATIGGTIIGGFAGLSLEPITWARLRR